MIEDRVTIYAAKMPRGEDREMLLECAQTIADLRREMQRKAIAIEAYSRSSAAACKEIGHLRLADDEQEAIAGMASYFDTRGNLTMQAWGSLLRILLLRMGGSQ